MFAQSFLLHAVLCLLHDSQHEPLLTADTFYAITTLV